MWSRALSTHSIDLYVAIGAKDLLVEGSGLELLTGSAYPVSLPELGSEEAKQGK